MAETGTSISHCPIVQLFLGSGTMPWKRTVAAGVNISAGTDFGGGDEWLIPRVLGDAFKVHITEPGDDRSVPAPRGDAVHRHPGRCEGTGHGEPLRQLRRRQGGRLRRRRPVGHPGCAALADAVRAADAELAPEQSLFALLMGIRESSIAGVRQGRHLDRSSRRRECHRCHRVGPPRRPGGPIRGWAEELVASARSAAGFVDAVVSVC